MATLLGAKPKDTFPLLIKFTSDYLGGSELRQLEDGSGNQIPLKMSASGVELAGWLWPTEQPSPGNVLVAGANNQLSWGSASGVTEAVQDIASEGAILILPPYADGVNYGVTLNQATQIVLPEVTNVPDSSLLAITVKIKQTANFAITWSGGESPITFDDPSVTPAGSGKTTIYSFVYYPNEDEWLGGVIWRKA